MKLFIILCCVTFLGCNVAYLEDRFDYSYLGGSLRVSKVTVFAADNVAFEFEKKELEKLENEIGRMLFSDTTFDDRNKFLKPTEKELCFCFSDGFNIKVDHEFGTIDGICILVIQLPDDHGFGGDIPVYVNLNDVLDRNRLDAIKNVLGANDGEQNKVPEERKRN